MSKLIILIFLLFLSISNGFSQNEIILNDSIKKTYNYEFTLSISILKLIEQGDFKQIFSLIDNSTIDKDAYKKDFKQIQNLIRQYGLPVDSLVTFQQFFIKIPPIMDQSGYLDKTIYFDFKIKDNITKDYFNRISIKFRTKREENFTSKTHNYVLSEISFDEASNWKKIQETINDILIEME